jgi:hypothetical protein
MATALSADSMHLTWSPAAGSEQTGYRIEQSSTAAEPFTAIAVVSSEATSYTTTGLNPNTTYLYRLVALNDTGESTPSNTLAGTTRSQTLTRPQNIRADLLADGSVRVMWVGGPTGAQAVIEVNPEGLVGFESLGTATATGPYIYTPVSPGNNRYRVKFVQGGNESPYGETPLRLATRGYGPVVLKSLYLPFVVK